MTTLSVRECGAIGDGIADDSDAIQQAVDRAIAEGRTVVLEPGCTYRISTPIQVRGAPHPGVPVLRGVSFSQHGGAWIYCATSETER